jgi:hypothetical protein
VALGEGVEAGVGSEVGVGDVVRTGTVKVDVAVDVSERTEPGVVVAG